MTVFMYAAAFHCEECGEEIRKNLARDAMKKMLEALDKELHVNLSKEKQLLFDLEDILIEHMEGQQVDTDDWPVSYPDAGEADSPQNCDSCHKPLEYSLTNDGIDYVVESVRETLRSGRENYCKIRESHDPDNDYYKDSPQFAVVKDWVEDMRYYNLDKRCSRIFRYIEWMERVYEQTKVKEPA